MSPGPGADGLREELEAYYRPLLPLWDTTLAGRGDLGLWRWAAEAWAGRPALELGAGSGRITEVLAEGPTPLVALDLNRDALRRARRRLAGRRPAAHFVLADMRRFRLGARFSLVACANDPFSHLRTDAGRSSALRRIADHLAGDGALILDALWFPEARRRRAAGPGGLTLERTVAADAAPETTVRHTWRCDPGSARCTGRFECRRGGEVVARSVFVGRHWTRGELERRLPAAGLRIEDVWGDYGRGPWTPQSEQLVVLAGPA